MPRKEWDEEEFDGFLDESTHHLAGAWEELTGDTLGTEELYALNDVLTAYFNGKR